MDCNCRLGGSRGGAGKAKQVGSERPRERGRPKGAAEAESSPERGNCWMERDRTRGETPDPAGPIENVPAGLRARRTRLA